ncbi:Acetyl-coenzyme A synthetase, chloroplastic/glyoxysomal [Galdieria sulphuraria]|nr:Acetyl-coenzyme A synthetase, chloroplastic/glyoxysomal [Galdieria sulphuraria]
MVAFQLTAFCKLQYTSQVQQHKCQRKRWFKRRLTFGRVRPLQLYSCTNLQETSQELQSGGDRSYPVPREYFDRVTNHHINNIEQYMLLYNHSILQPDEFWSDKAKQVLSWKQLWDDQICSFNFDVEKGPIFCEWFKGGKLNACYNCIDRHVEAGHGDQVAYYAEGNEESADIRGYTYRELLDYIERLASVLKARGVHKGDVVAIYMPNIPELVIAMLACARIGAIHSVVFGGFSAESLANRLLDAKSRVVITCDGYKRGEKIVPLKTVADAAAELARETLGYNLVEHKIIYQRLNSKEHTATMDGHVDEWWHEALSKAEKHCAIEWMDAEDPLFVLYTSGSTGRPKGIVHTTGGYLLYAALTHRYAFNYHPGDVYFCTADCGWITGHSYVVYGPLVNRATQVIFEGVPTYPSADRLWKISAKYKVKQLYTAPTLIRSLMRFGEKYVKNSQRDSLTLLATVGEPINPEAWKWFSREVGENLCPIVDTWWQTETGGHMILPPPVQGFYQKPGSASIPFFGIVPVVVNEKGEELFGECEGYLCIKKPWPGMFRTVLGDHSRMESTYFKPFRGYYMSGDGCRRDKDGYYWLTGRVDDVINVSGHRIGTAEVESALIAHGSVAEAAVVPAPHDIKGQGIYAYVTLREGAICTPDVIHWAPALPKTRSGKIMRRILRKIAELGTNVTPNDLGDTSTLSDPQVVDMLVSLYGK